ncbi:B12-binding domain-containing radical SAM protein [Candidatus Sumerlaeota bacterium]
MKIQRFHKALLINPPSGNYRRDDRCQVKVADQTVAISFPPIELAYAAAVLREQGVEARIGDYPALGLGWADYKAQLREFAPDVLIVSTTTATIAGDLEACRLAREVCPEIRTFGRGEFLTVSADEVLPAHAELDFILLGEAEPTLREVAGGIEAEDVCGLAWLEDGKARRGEPRLPDEDADSLPFPARELLANERYLSPDTRRPITVIHANRGCPSKCIFCPAGALSNYRVRLRSPQRVVDELVECVERHGIRQFLFHGDTFTINKRWVLELCERIGAAGLDIRWGCNSRVDTMDDERAAAMRQAGCWVVAFGLESGSQEILDKIKKGATVEKAREAIAVCKRNGLCTHGFWIIGMPWETRVTLRLTYQLARELDTDFFDFNIALPLPGTELYEIAVGEGLLEQALDTETGYAKAAARTFELSRRELDRWRRRSLLKLSFRPGYVFRTLRRARANGQLGNYLAAGLRRLRNITGG